MAPEIRPSMRAFQLNDENDDALDALIDLEAALSDLTVSLLDWLRRACQEDTAMGMHALTAALLTLVAHELRARLNAADPPDLDAGFPFDVEGKAPKSGRVSLRLIARIGKGESMH